MLIYKPLVVHSKRVNQQIDAKKMFIGLLWSYKTFL